MCSNSELTTRLTQNWTASVPVRVPPVFMLVGTMGTKEEHEDRYFMYYNWKE